MAGPNSGNTTQGWRARDGRVINPGDLLMPVHPAHGPGGVAWINMQNEWMVALDKSKVHPDIVSDLLHPWLMKCGYNPGDDTFNVQIVMNMLNKETAVE